MAEVVARQPALIKSSNDGCSVTLPAVDEDETLGDFAQDLELPRLVRMQADEHEPVAPRAAGEEIAA